MMSIRPDPDPQAALKLPYLFIHSAAFFITSVSSSVTKYRYSTGLVIIDTGIGTIQHYVVGGGGWGRGGNTLYRYVIGV
jgi:hypothetical protein